MGFFRLILAIMVVFEHLDLPFAIFDSRFAVQMFFFVSGFYMSLVWSERYCHYPKPIKTFYTSRALRIYPVYLLVLFASALVAYCAMKNGDGLALMAQKESPLTVGALTVVSLTQLTILGMAPHMFLTRLADGGLGWILNFHLSEAPYIHHYDLVPQAWTLDLELTFYLLVPFVLSRVRIMLTILVASLLARIFFWNFGLDVDPWTYRFFPFEFAIFLMGSLSHRYWNSARSWIVKVVTTRLAWAVIGLSPILMSVAFNVIHKELGEAAYWICYLYAFFTLPILFNISRNSKIDRWIGELSFPIYISHFLVVNLFLIFGKPVDTIYPPLICTVMLSAMLSQVQRLIDVYRHSIANSGSSLRLTR